MKEQSNSTYIAIIAGIVIIGGFLGYYFFYKGSTPTTLTMDTTTSSVSPQAQNILALLSNLQTVNLDSSVFKDKYFLSLQSFGGNITEEPYGRPNPFAPVGFTGTPVSGNSLVASTTPVKGALR